MVAVLGLFTLISLWMWRAFDELWRQLTLEITAITGNLLMFVAIVWGGAAGCMPVLIAWAAVTGTLSWTPVILFLIVFWWTPPHYWPLSMRYKEDYANAGVPMLPVVRKSSTVAIQIILYSWAMVTSALLLIPVAQMGWTYIVVSVVAGGWFVFEAYRLYRQGMKGEVKNPMRLFHMANTYLTLLFVVIAIDPLLPF